MIALQPWLPSESRTTKNGVTEKKIARLAGHRDRAEKAVRFFFCTFPSISLGSDTR
jgi:hypothetical protein